MRKARGLEMFSLSDKGQARSENQDSILVDLSQALFILADGVGGGRGGRAASRLTVDTMAATLGRIHGEIRLTSLWNPKAIVAQLTRTLCDAAQAANRAVVDRAAADPDLTGMASTLVAGVVDAHRCVSISAGDSRIYRFRAGRLEQISQDHSLARSLIDQGFLSEDEARAEKYRNVLTQAVGLQDNIEVSTYNFPMDNGDILLACSDGLTNMVSDATIAEVLAAPGPLQDKVEVLVRLANEAGGRDNISVILASGTRPRTIFSRLFRQYLESP